MEWRPAGWSVCLPPMHHKVQKFSGTGSPGWSWKKVCKTVVVVGGLVLLHYWFDLRAPGLLKYSSCESSEFFWKSFFRDAHLPTFSRNFSTFQVFTTVPTGTDKIPLFRFLWSLYGIRQTIIFSSCRLFFFLASFFPRLISAAADWMSAILPHMVWP